MPLHYNPSKAVYPVYPVYPMFHPPTCLPPFSFKALYIVVFLPTLLDSLTSIRNKERKNVFTGSTMSDFYETKELIEKNILKNPDNVSILRT